jgi:hypothetical protein
VNEQIDEYLSERPNVKSITNQSGADMFMDTSKLNFNVPEYDSEIDENGRNSEVNQQRLPSFAKGPLPLREV